MRRWLNDGEVLAPADGESTNLYGKIAVLVSGQAIAPGSPDPIVAPASLDLAEGGILTVVPKYLSVTHTENLMNGGEGGIRTRGTLRYTAFPMLHNRPLCHLSTVQSAKNLYAKILVCVNVQNKTFFINH